MNELNGKLLLPPASGKLLPMDVSRVTVTVTTRGGVAVRGVQQPPPYGGVAVGAVIPAFPSSQVTTVYVIMTTLLTTSGTV